MRPVGCPRGPSNRIQLKIRESNTLAGRIVTDWDLIILNSLEVTETDCNWSLKGGCSELVSSRLKTGLASRVAEWMAATVLRSTPAERTEGRVHIDLRMSVIRQPLLEWCSSTLTELGGSVGAKEHTWRDIAVPADQWQEVLSSARAHHAEATLFRTKDTVVTVEADEEDASLLEVEGEEEGKDDDN